MDINEIFADTDSEEEFEGFSDSDLQDITENSSESEDEDDGHVPRINPTRAYSHPWLLNFSRIGVGPLHLPDDPTGCDLMKLFLTEEVLETLVTETNRYAKQYLDSHENLSQFSRLLKWTDTNISEMRAFIAILLLTGISKRSSYELYWSSDPLLDMKGFRDIMSRDRFMNILSFFHLVDNDNALPADHPDHDRAYKIRPLINFLVPLWQHHYKPDKEISVDESMIPFKGRTSLLQYMPAKPTKWGLKAWGLADARTGYMYNWQLYLGKDRNNNGNTPVTQRVVTSLCEPLYGMGHVVYMDNLFSSPALFQELQNHQTGACGTLRVNRIGVPQCIKVAKPKSDDPPVTERVGNTLFIVWCDKRAVSVITTVHSGITFRKTVRSKRHNNNVRVVDKPVAIQAYTQHMGGIDRADKAMTFYMVLHRCVKWWKKVFFYLLEVCFCNALIIWRGISDKRINAEKFRLQIVHGMLEGYVRPFSSNLGRPVRDPPARLVGGEHYLALNPKRLANGARSKPDCVVCSNRINRRHQTIYMCRKCNKTMCPVPCFERYHTLGNFKIDCTPAIHQ